MLKLKPYLKLAVYVVTSVIIALLCVRFWLYLSKSPIPPVLVQVTEALLFPIPGKLSDVNLAQAGFDIHAPIGVGFFLLLAWGLTFVIDKLIRENLIKTISGIIDIWASVMLCLIVFGYALISFGMNPGSSLITDMAMGLVNKASQGSIISQPHLMALFLFISVLIFNILTDYLLQLKFAVLYFELTDSESTTDLKATDIASSWSQKISMRVKEFLANLNILETFRRQREKMTVAVKETVDQAKHEGVTPWKTWADGYIKHKQTLASYIEP